MLRPSLTLVLDLDERSAGKETVLEIKRSYAHIGTPVIRTHPAKDDGAPPRNRARFLVKMGTHRYLHAADEGADELWESVVEPWIGNVLHKVGNNMVVFNDRQRSIGLPETVFERADIELQGGELVIGLHPDPRSWLDPQLNGMVGAARNLVDDGTLAGAARIDMPSDESYEAQREAAWNAWAAEHPEVAEAANAPGDAEGEGEEDEGGKDGASEAATEPAKTREQLLREDAEAKSYENTAVPPTNSRTLPRPQREEPEPEPERFSFEVDYALWSVEYADGTRRTFDSAQRSFVG